MVLIAYNKEGDPKLSESCQSVRPHAIRIMSFFELPRKSWTIFWTLALILALTYATILVEDLTMATNFLSTPVASTESNVDGSSALTNRGSSTGSQVHTKRKRFPSFEDGGVVVFLHVAKTGGTSIRRNFGNFSHIEMNTLYTMDQWNDAADVADRILTRKIPEDERRILFMEPHGMRSLGMPTLHQYLRRWRRFAAMHNTSFFAFTLVREPVSYAVSYFNVSLSIHDARRLKDDGLTPHSTITNINLTSVSCLAVFQRQAVYTPPLSLETARAQ